MGDLELSEEERLLDAEFRKWHELHLPHPKDVYQVDAFHLVCGFDALSDLLIEKEIINKDEYTAFIFKTMREKMEMMKPEITKLVRQSGIAPNNGTKLFGPDGRPLI